MWPLRKGETDMLLQQQKIHIRKIKVPDKRGLDKDKGGGGISLGV